MGQFKKLLVTILVLLTFRSVAVSQSGNWPKWNGYIQTRVASNFDKFTEFTVRRSKLWVYGSLPKANYVSYKVQMVYRSFKDETVVLQDALANIRLRNFGEVKIGRFVPDFMLQRIQPDYEIPVLERASVINSLTINEKQMGREVGAQYTLQSNAFHFSVGVFNANVDAPSHSKDNSFLSTSRLEYKVIHQNNFWVSIGGSVAYRYLNGLTMANIYNADSTIIGDDFRWGVETQLHWNKFDLQGEYVQANINSDAAKGWYGIACYSFLTKYQVIALTEKYIDLNPDTNNNCWVGVGVNYKITGKTKLMADFKAQEEGSEYNYLGDIQLQVFFN
ncbi:MAG: porin [Bacteroidales bacterium]|nr:porin [Bacteroidales bacterium]